MLYEIRYYYKAVTKVNVSDANGLLHICPYNGMIYADKGYADQHAQIIMRKKKCINLNSEFI